MKERVYYVYDADIQRNIYKRLDLFEAQSEARRLNKKEGRKRYSAKGAWVFHKLS